MLNAKEALLKLDVNDDTQWTSDGQPRLDSVRSVAANPAITRAEILEVAPGFSRSNPNVEQGKSAEMFSGSSKVKEDVSGELVHPWTKGNSEKVQDTAETKAPENPAIPATNAPETKLPEVEESLDGRIAQLNDNINYHMRERDELNALIRELQKERDTLLMARDRNTVVSKGESVAEVTRRYRESQQADMVERARRAQLVLETGVDLHKVVRDLHSPLDQVLKNR